MKYHSLFNYFDPKKASCHRKWQYDNAYNRLPCQGKFSWSHFRVEE